MNLLSQIALYYEIDKNKLYGRHHSAHLIQTAGLLRKYGCRKNVISAGLIHSIYDSNSVYKNKGVPKTDRKNIIDIANKEVEELVYYYSLLHALENYNYILSDTFPEQLISDLSDILVCDIIEQIIWCVEEKKFFTYQDAYDHLNKLFPVVSYCRENIKKDYHHYLHASLT
ncbi:DUF6817 domain-containing protein [Xenorhabdus sp. KJ12.1]|uniref:DUF6817 domain-containing protein n=1 Tax=Xenorhabdus sp. KJ12.1 TaxID=1851571 RepID=UPI000C054089|nr:hypothetical protein [Xenorhabdus sp. KJ12.1]PHM72394.1 hypothetical protein Xekj_00673 [Xenorhabdus sp. KJ12.1]